MLRLKQKIAPKSSPRKSLKISHHRYLTTFTSIKLVLTSSWKTISPHGSLDVSIVLRINNPVSSTLMGRPADNVACKRNSCRKPSFRTIHDLINQNEIQFS
ncbi:Hypothetical predicted protein [Octopus vulgaris]|uniref:Uncharacterized protein n=1 Tax=Octopus vulgaris TaxID=6645 RepID=A0AA36AVE5_OCTVU|nr:Hypothetical predicted protein [Octopus vulgaris]